MGVVIERSVRPETLLLDLAERFVEEGVGVGA
jgi:hypothetical protein